MQMFQASRVYYILPQLYRRALIHNGKHFPTRKLGSDGQIRRADCPSNVQSHKSTRFHHLHTGVYYRSCNVDRPVASVFEQLQGETAIVQAADGGQVTVKLLRVSQQDASLYAHTSGRL